MKKIVLFGLTLILFLSCSENTTTPLLDPFTKTFLAFPETEIDGGLFLISTAKNNDSPNPSWIRTRVVLHYKNWPGNITIYLDDSLITHYTQRVNISPFINHTWNVLENQQIGIPRIQKTISALQPLTIYDLHNYDTIARNQTITWNPPQNDTSTKIFVLLQKIESDTTATDSIWVVPRLDNGSFTFSDEYYNTFQPGDKIKIDIFRVKSEIEIYANKKYLFATLFETNLILYIK